MLRGRLEFFKKFIQIRTSAHPRDSLCLGGPSLGHLKLDHFDIVDFHSACTMCGEARVASASCPLVTMPNTADQRPALHLSTCHYTSTPYHHDITLHNITPLHYTSTPYHTALPYIQKRITSADSAFQYEKNLRKKCVNSHDKFREKVRKSSK